MISISSKGIRADDVLSILVVALLISGYFHLDISNTLGMAVLFFVGTKVRSIGTR